MVIMKRILIIEDTDTIREELTKLLTRYGYEVFFFKQKTAYEM